jgi:magnesium transporter
MLGMVTIDDVVDIMEAEATEDALKQVGAGTGEAVYSGVKTKLKGRGPWLLVNLVTAGTASSILLAFQGLIAEFAVAAVLFPIIANQSGNAGFQSLAVTLRGLVLGEIHPERVRPLLAREATFGVIAGVVVGVVIALASMVLGEIGQATGSGLLSEFSWRIGAVAGVAMAGALTASCLIGTLIPLGLKRLGVDPATASSIFLTMLTDMTSFGTFLGLVLVLHDWVGGGTVPA